MWPVFAFFASAPFALAGWGYCWYQALRRLSPTGEAKAKARGLAWFTHDFTSRQDFTAVGWRYLCGAFACQTLPLIAAATCAIIVQP